MTDRAIIEAAARALQSASAWTIGPIMARSYVETVAPLIEAAALEREPTEEMLIAARDWSYAKYGKPIGNDAAQGCYRAMAAAAIRALKQEASENDDGKTVVYDLEHPENKG